MLSWPAHLVMLASLFSVGVECRLGGVSSAIATTEAAGSDPKADGRGDFVPQLPSFEAFCTVPTRPYGFECSSPSDTVFFKAAAGKNGVPKDELPKKKTGL
jgi:hypothetical protein